MALYLNLNERFLTRDKNQKLRFLLAAVAEKNLHAFSFIAILRIEKILQNENFQLLLNIFFEATNGEWSEIITIIFLANFLFKLCALIDPIKTHRLPAICALRLSQNEQNSAVLEIHQKSNEINIHGFPLYDGMMELSRFENY